MSNKNEASYSISKMFHATILIITFIAIALLAIFSISARYKVFYSESEEIRKQYLTDQEQIIKYEIERAVKDIYQKYVNRTSSIIQFEQSVINQYREIRFPNKGKDLGFFFIKTYDGIQKLSVSKLQVEGTDISKYQDPNGIITHDLFMNIVNERVSGFADYSWYNPYTEKNQKKRSFIKAIPQLEWYIGAGFWFEDINTVIEAKTK